MVNVAGTKSTRPLVDWEAVARDFRAGMLSLAELSQKHGVAKSRISVVSRRDGWDRDLSARIDAKAAALVNAAAVNAGVNAKEAKVSDEQVVAANSQLKASVLLSERDDVAATRALHRKLAAVLVDAIDAAPKLAEIGAALDRADEVSARRLDLFNRVIDLPAQIKAAKDLADMQRTTIDLEGRLFGISGAEGSPASVRDLPEDQLQQRLKTILERAGKRVVDA